MCGRDDWMPDILPGCSVHIKTPALVLLQKARELPSLAYLFGLNFVLPVSWDGD